MANYRLGPITANTTGEAAFSVQVKKPRSLDTWFATLNARGSFGGGTLSYSISTDSGVTKTQLKDSTGVAYSTATADCVNIQLGVPSTNDPLKQMSVYVVVSGSTTPSIFVDVEDNT